MRRLRLCQVGLSAASENGRDSYRTSSACWTHNAFQKEVPDSVLHGGVAAIVGMAVSLKKIYDDNVVWWNPWMDDYLGLDDCAQHEISESFCMT